MSKANFRKVNGKSGSGRFVVPEGIAPSCDMPWPCGKCGGWPAVLNWKDTCTCREEEDE